MQIKNIVFWFLVASIALPYFGAVLPALVSSRTYEGPILAWFITPALVAVGYFTYKRLNKKAEEKKNA